MNITYQFPYAKKSYGVFGIYSLDYLFTKPQAAKQNKNDKIIVPIKEMNVL